MARAQSHGDALRAVSKALGAGVALASSATFALGALSPAVHSLGRPLIEANQQALLAGLLGVTLTLRQHPLPGLRRLAATLALAVAFTALMVVAEHVLGISLGFGRWRFPDGLGALRGSALPPLSLPSALVLFMLGLAVWFGERRHGLPSDALALVSLGYLFITALIVALRVSSLYGMPFTLPVGWILLIALALGILVSHPDRGLMKAVSSETPTGVVLRRLVPTALLGPTLIGWLWAEGIRLRIVQAPEGMFFAVLAMTGVTMGIVAWNVYPLQRLERARREAVDALRQKETEALVRAAELKKAEELNRLKDHFLSTISHEMKTPLSLIGGYAELLEEAHPHDPNVAGIKEGGRRLSEHIDNILDYSALISGTLPLYKTEVDLAEVLFQVEARVHEGFQRAGIALETDIAPDTPLIDADYRRVSQVLMELLENAQKFTPRGGKAGVRIAPDQDMARIEVWNTGEGIPEEDCERIWEAFHQLASSDAFRKGGLGLGLTIVKLLVELHGGSVGVHCPTGDVTTFSVLLPAKPAPPGADAP